MKRKAEHVDRATGVACRDLFGTTFPSSTFPNFLEVYIAFDNRYTPPDITGVHCIYFTHIPPNAHYIRSCVTNRQSTQIVVSCLEHAVIILQMFAPSFSAKSLNLNDYL